jgi:hypothetical protein
MEVDGQGGNDILPLLDDFHPLETTVCISLLLGSDCQFQSCLRI